MPKQLNLSAIESALGQSSPIQDQEIKLTDHPNNQANVRGINENGESVAINNAEITRSIVIKKKVLMPTKIAIESCFI